MDASFTQALNAWQTINFVQLQRTLDEQGIKIAENQENGVQSRKLLSSKTKEFKKLEDTEKLGEIKALLKLYQTEIDTLTNRSKFTESCFMNCYKQLGEAPDPLPLLSASQNGIKVTADLQKLRLENSEMQEKLSKCADYDQLKAKLLDMEMKQAEQLASRLKAKEAEINAKWDEKEKVWTSQHEELSTEVKELRGLLKIAQAQVLQTSSSNDVSEQHLKLAELNATARELQNQSSKVAQLESRNVQLRQEIEATKAGAKLQELKEEYTTKLDHLERDNVVLSARIETATKKAKSDAENQKLELQKLNSSFESVKQELNFVNSQLAKQQDYQQIKKELDVLRSIEFGDASPVSQNSETLDRVLQKKNSQLNEELATLRVKYQKLENENEGIQTSLLLLREQSTRDKETLKRLEDDLGTLNSSRENDTFSTISGWTAVPRRVSPASSIIGDSSRSPATTAASAGASDQVLQIITQQRDRFKDRAQSLEKELHQASQTSSLLAREIEALKQDNRELFERGASTKKARSRGAYEEGYSALQQFKDLETEKQQIDMSAVDRVIFEGFKQGLIDKKVRYGAAGYITFIHLMLLLKMI